MEDVLNEVVLDGPHHRVEHLIALTLILDQRIALPHGPKSDSLLEVIHLIEMLSPLRIEHVQKDPSFDISELLFSRFWPGALVRRRSFSGEFSNQALGKRWTDGPEVRLNGLRGKRSPNGGPKGAGFPPS